MLPNSVLLGSLASLLAPGNASPVPQLDEVIIIDEVATDVGRPIRWLRESDGVELCLQVEAITGPPEVQLRNGGGVTFGYCFSERSADLPFQQWVYNTGSTKVCVAPNSYSDTQYCLDFGTDLGANGQPLKIWQAYDVPQQQLYITDDLHISVENGPGQCVDVKAESGPLPDYARAYGSQKSVQTWECSFANTNQIFIFDTPAPEVGRPITWKAQDGTDLCLQVDSRTGTLQEQLVNGAILGINTCFSETSDYLPFQRWVYNRGSTKICVAPNQYSDTEFCIDFGTNLGSNGQTLYIWQAYEGLPQQQLYITDDNHIAVEGGNQCADVKAESGPQPDYARPYGSLKDVQSYQCFFGNTNQIFGFST